MLPDPKTPSNSSLPPLASDTPTPPDAIQSNDAAVSAGDSDTAPDPGTLKHMHWAAFSARLQAWCDALGLTPYRLAGLAQVSHNTVGSYLDVNTPRRLNRRVYIRIRRTLRKQYRQDLLQRSRYGRLTQQQIKQRMEKGKRSLKALDGAFKRVCRDYTSQRSKTKTHLRERAPEESQEQTHVVPVLSVEAEHTGPENASSLAAEMPGQIPVDPRSVPAAHLTAVPVARDTTQVTGNGIMPDAPDVPDSSDIREPEPSTLAAPPARPPAAEPQPDLDLAQHLLGRRATRILSSGISMIAAARAVLTLITIVMIIAITVWFVVPHVRLLLVATHPMQTTVPIYYAAIPGWGCDHGSANWDNDTATRMVCLGAWGVVTGTTQGQTFAQERFYPPLGNRALTLGQYRAGVIISQLAPGTCAGLQYQQSDSDTIHYHYSAAVCWDGSYAILRLDKPGRHATLLSTQGAHVPRASAYNFVLTFSGGVQSLTINGRALPSVTDTLAGTGEFISLATSNNAGGPVHAAFAHFTFENL